MYTEKHLTEGGSRCRGHRGHVCQLHSLSHCGTSLAISYCWVLSFAEWHLWEGATVGSQDHRGLWTHGTYQVGAKWTREWKGDVGRAQGKLTVSGRKKREKVLCVRESLCFFLESVLVFLCVCHFRILFHVFPLILPPTLLFLFYF